MLKRTPLPCFILLAAMSLQALASQQVLEHIRRHRLSGGLIVQVGVDDPIALTSYARGNLIVQGLDMDPRKVDRGRKQILTEKRYGSVSLQRLYSPEELPYRSNLVRILIVKSGYGLTREEMLRVVTPGGQVFISNGDSWEQLTKQWPAEMDQWNHFLHGPDNNAVSNDELVEPPRHCEWTASPMWGRSHEITPSVIGVITAAGRLFYVEDLGPRGVVDSRLPEKWALTARDAQSGLLLWRKRIPSWTKGPVYWLRYNVNENLRMVADEKCLYVSIGPDRAVASFDAETGEEITRFADTAGTSQVLLKKPYLIGCSGNKLTVIDVEVSRTVWQKEHSTIPGQVAFDGRRIVMIDSGHLLAVDIKRGDVLWRYELANLGRDSGTDFRARKRMMGIRLVLHDEVVVIAFPGAKNSDYDIAAFDAQNGGFLWRQCSAKSQRLYFVSPRELFIVNGIVWASVSGVGFELKSGKKVHEMIVDSTGGHHHRCHNRKATVRYLMGSKRGIEYFSYTPGVAPVRNDWLRGACRVGVVPANGLTYVPPHACFCNPGVMLKGFHALAGKTSVYRPKPYAGNRVLAAERPYVDKGLKAGDGDWPMYRHDASRSGHAQTRLPATLRQKWKVAFAADISPPVIAGGSVFLAEKDSCLLHALDEASGRKQWSFVADGRIDSAPTWPDGYLYFGCRNGYVYCLDSEDGALVWKFLAAPSRCLITSYERTESVWPVHGSVLVQDGNVYCTAGRSTFLDGGISCWALDAKSGKTVLQNTFYDVQTEENKEHFTTHSINRGAHTDLLVSDGRYLYMGQNQLDLRLKPIRANLVSRAGQAEMPLHLGVSSGFLDTSLHNRSQWTYWRSWPGAHYATRAPKAGQILVFDDDRTYGIKIFDHLPANDERGQKPNKRPGVWPRMNLSRSPADSSEEGNVLFADANDNEPRKPGPFRELGGGFRTRLKPALWETIAAIRGKAMAVTRNCLVVAGSPSEFDTNDPLAKYEDRTQGVLMVIDKTDGKAILETPMDHPPVFDGVAAANGKLFIADVSNTISCWNE
ncbi:MAG: PQQ-binding-like beta-propeller repeat protein [Lentisphaerae bacterium]|nr:PQQ-binding-like beta-propeller repeat protein [Lentisphaerota bacterium]